MKHYLLLIGAAVIAVSARGSVMYSIDPSTSNVLPGSMDAFDVVLTNMGSAITVGTFTFEVTVAGTAVSFTGADFTPTSFPYIFAGTSVDEDFSIPLYSSIVPSQILDASDSSDSAGVTLASGESLSLGQVLFSVSKTATVGSSFAVTFTSSQGTNSLSSPTGGNIPINTLNSGMINITPEPSSAVLLIAGLTWLSFKARSRRR